MKSIFSAIFLLMAGYASAQRCNCKERLQFVQQQIERNYAGFSDKVKPANKAAYSALTSREMQLAGSAQTLAECAVIMHDWIAFFKDGHIQWVLDDVKEGDTAAERMRANSAEVLTLSPKVLQQISTSADPVEGIYVRDDSAYAIAVVRNKNRYRDYAGVVTYSKTDAWKPGQVKLELKKEGPKKLTAVVYRDDHAFRVRDYTLDKVGFGDWIKTPRTLSADAAASQDVAEARKIGDHTLYIRISSFDGELAQRIDSVVKSVEPLLQTMPHLVIDVRDNGGGSDFSYRSITPWLYTNPVIRVGADVWSTQDNIDGWQAKVMDEPSVPDDIKEETRPLMVAMKKSPGTFVNSGPDDTTVLQEVKPFPKKVVVLMNSGCASSAEQFILAARQSKKVTLMGEHSEGVLDYGNMRPSGKSPCGDVILWYATTRSRRVNIGQGIDNVGIKPDVVLNKDKDWVREAVQWMDKQP